LITKENKKIKEKVNSDKKIKYKKMNRNNNREATGKIIKIKGKKLISKNKMLRNIKDKAIKSKI
jgi:uncharacterized protein YdbL (DUF1318 family)